MTRINVIPPKQLSRQHLIAEYRELPRVFTLARNREGSTKDVPLDYCLGKGHVLFFTLRLEFLSARYFDLIIEMRRRGYKPNHVPFKKLRDGIPKHCFQDYKPTRAAIRINRQRIKERTK